MFNNQHWYYGLTRGYSALFANMFNDIKIVRTNSVGDVTQVIACPIDFATKQKIIRKINEDGDLKQNVATTLPRLSFALTGLSRDYGRQLIPITKNMVQEDSDKTKIRMNYMFVPVDMVYELYVYVKNLDDGYQIFEQIIPFFLPDWTIKVGMLKPMKYQDNVVITLDDYSFTDNYEGAIDTRRMVIWTYRFTMKARYYGPMKTSGLIKRAIADLIVPPGKINPSELPEDVVPLEQLIVTPGVTANNEPTTDPLLTIPYQNVEQDSNWDYIVEIRTSNTSMENV